MIVTNIAELKLPNERAAPDEVSEIIRRLEIELAASPRAGVGLAAPQIGIRRRVAIIRTKGASINLVNPVLVEKEHSIVVRGEGCLSLPGMSIDTWRSDEVFVKCDENPGGIVATGLEAVVIQHEMDHLDGILMTDRSTSLRIGRNDPCPCGARNPDGKPVKFKRCHGK
jgi:peptide deformylase